MAENRIGKQVNISWFLPTTKVPSENVIRPQNQIEKVLINIEKSTNNK